MSNAEQDGQRSTTVKFRVGDVVTWGLGAVDYRVIALRDDGVVVDDPQIGFVSWEGRCGICRELGLRPTSPLRHASNQRCNGGADGTPIEPPQKTEQGSPGHIYGQLYTAPPSVHHITSFGATDEPAHDTVPRQALREMRARAEAAERRANDLSDMVGTCDTTNRQLAEAHVEILAENATLRRRIEKLEARRGK